MVSLEQKKFLADMYVTNFTMVLRDKNKDKAFKLLTESREKVLALLKKHSVDPKDYEFLSARLEDEWKYDNKKRHLVGYMASQYVNVSLSTKMAADSLEMDLAALSFVENMQTGARLKNADSLEVDVIKSACKKASKMAGEYAESVGAQVGKVIMVNGTSSVESLSLSDSVEVTANMVSALSLKGVGDDRKSYVHVGQSEEKNYAADKFEVVLTISINGTSKETLIKQIAEKKDAAVKLAQDLGVAESEIDVQSMNIRKRSSWELDYYGSKNEIYSARQMVRVNFVTKDGASAYVNSVVVMENVEMDLVRPVLRNEDSLKVLVTNLAGKKAMARAKAIAEGFGGKLGNVVSVNNQDVEYGSRLSGLLGGGAQYMGGHARGKTALGRVNGVRALMDAASPTMGLSIADSVLVSSNVNVTVEIK